MDLSVRAQWLGLRRALPAPLHRKTGARVQVVFGECQEVDELDVAVDGLLRSEIQHHAGQASYVFAGSAIRMMELKFTEAKRAFYEQTIAVPVPRVPEAYSPPMSTSGPRERVKGSRAPPSAPWWTWSGAIPSELWSPPTTSGTTLPMSPAWSSGTAPSAE